MEPVFQSPDGKQSQNKATQNPHSRGRKKVFWLCVDIFSDETKPNLFVAIFFGEAVVWFWQKVSGHFCVTSEAPCQARRADFGSSGKIDTASAEGDVFPMSSRVGLIVSVLFLVQAIAQAIPPEKVGAYERAPAFNRRTMVDAYEKAGRKNPCWALRLGGGETDGL